MLAVQITHLYNVVGGASHEVDGVGQEEVAVLLDEALGRVGNVEGVVPDREGLQRKIEK